MMRWVAVVVVGLAGLVGLVGTAAWAHDEGGAHTITGEVVDLACYLGHGAQGLAHQECAKKCIASGLPVGIKSGNTIYVAVGIEHGTANAALAPLAGQTVTVEGEITERDEMHLVAIKKVTAHQ